MTSQEHLGETLFVAKSKDSEIIQISTNTTSDNLMNLTNLQQTSPITAATKAQQEEQQQQFSKKKPNKLNAAIVLNVKCHCEAEKSDYISSNTFGFREHHCMNSVYFHELPKKISLLSTVIDVAGTSVGISDSNEKKLYLADRKRFWPPPIFILFISLLEVSKH